MCGVQREADLFYFIYIVEHYQLSLTQIVSFEYDLVLVLMNMLFELRSNVCKKSKEEQLTSKNIKKNQLFILIFKDIFHSMIHDIELQFIYC